MLGENSEEIDLISILESTGQVSASSAAGSYPTRNICDGNENSFWRENSRQNSWVEWDFRMDAVVRRVEILAKESSSGRSTTPPRDFRLQCSADRVNWTNLYSGTLTSGNQNYQAFNISSPQPARYFRISIISRYNSNRYAAINEVKLTGSMGYLQEGARISQGIPFSGPGLPRRRGLQ